MVRPQAVMTVFNSTVTLTRSSLLHVTIASAAAAAVAAEAAAVAAAAVCHSKCPRCFCPLPYHLTPISIKELEPI